MVARVAEHTNFVFNLHHQHCVVTGIHLFQVLHERRKCVGVCFLRGRALRAQNLDGIAILDDARKAARILLDPDRHVTRQAVLPRGKPKEDDALVFMPCLIDEAVDEGEVVGPFFGLDQLPTQRSHHRIKAHRLELRPDGLHVFQVRRGRVVQLA